MEAIWCIFGLTAAEVAHRLADMPALCPVQAADGTVSVPVPDEVAEEVTSRLGVYIYSRQGETLAARVVALLKEHGKTVATAESCTGGLIAAALTDIPGSSAVIGTGVVSYSNDCKQRLLEVSEDTIQQYGVVSAPVATQMARGVRRAAAADVAVAVTGEAGPVASGQQPVGTVFIGLADHRRSWVRECHLEGDREAVRRQAVANALDLLRRYLEAFPAVMAGGEPHQREPRRRVIPTGKKQGGHSWLWYLFPHGGEPLRHRLMKLGAILAAVAVLTGCLWLGYSYLMAPDANRELQETLGDIYWGQSGTLPDSGEVDADAAKYPVGMMATFRGLYDRNRDVAGWLRIPDTPLDYPVMDYADGYYNSHSFDGQYSLYGQPHVDAGTQLSADGNGRVVSIYGRNVGGEMFSTLLDYRRLAFLRQNSRVEFNTLYATATYEVFAVMVVDESDDGWSPFNTAFDTDEAFMTYIQQLQAHSLYSTDGSFTPEDQLLLLTTDAREEYDFSGARLIVAARRLPAKDRVSHYHLNDGVILPDAMTHAQRTTGRRPVTTKTTKHTTRTTRKSKTTRVSTTDWSTTVTTDVTTTTVTTHTTAAGDDTTATNTAGPTLTTVATTATTATGPTTAEATTTGTTIDTERVTTTTQKPTEVNAYADIGN